MILDSEGRIARANQAARDRFGSPIGRRCADVVDICTTDRRRICTHGCALELIETGDGQRETRGKVKGRPAEVLCSAVGDEVVVTIGEADAFPAAHEHLTPRETEVLQRVSEGLTGKQIAQHLGVSPATIRTHVEHIRDKLGCRTRAEAVARALALGLLA